MENEIQVGDYCRTKNGLIAKLIEPQVYEINDREYIEFLEDIVKHSSNLIDILEVGDFIHTDYGWGWYHHKVDENTIVIDDGNEFIDVNKDEIHRILTQEKMLDNSYEV